MFYHETTAKCLRSQALIIKLGLGMIQVIINRARRILFLQCQTQIAVIISEGMEQRLTNPIIDGVLEWSKLKISISGAQA